MKQATMTPEACPVVASLLVDVEDKVLIVVALFNVEAKVIDKVDEFCGFWRLRASKTSIAGMIIAGKGGRFGYMHFGVAVITAAIQTEHEW
jgi:hypothetical protein